MNKLEEAMNRPIGVFDTGIGGMTVLIELEKILAKEQYIYYADTKNNPYGDKSKEEIQELVDKHIAFFKEQAVKLVVIACNTASVVDIDQLREKYDLPIITVIDATLDAIREEDKNIAVIATQATIDSNKHKSMILEAFPDKKVYPIAAPRIAPIIEFENLSDDQAQNIVDDYIFPYRDKEIDSLILACTHFPIWQDHFSKALPQADLINPARNTARKVKDFLIKHDILCNQDKTDTREDIYFVSGDLEVFKEKLAKIFDKKEKNVRKG